MSTPARLVRAEKRRARIAARRLREVKAGGWSPALPIAPGAPVIVWVSGWWDGPIDGLCRIGVRRYWFELLRMEGPDERRVYSLHPYEGDFATFRDHWHGEFQKYVGTHWDFADGARTRGGAPLVARDHDRFYGPYQAAVCPPLPPAVARFDERDWRPART